MKGFSCDRPLTRGVAVRMGVLETGLKKCAKKGLRACRRHNKQPQHRHNSATERHLDSASIPKRLRNKEMNHTFVSHISKPPTVHTHTHTHTRETDSHMRTRNMHARRQRLTHTQNTTQKHKKTTEKQTHYSSLMYSYTYTQCTHIPNTHSH